MPWIRFDDEQLEALKDCQRAAAGCLNYESAARKVKAMLTDLEENAGDPRYREYAEDHLARDGDLEFDDDAVISEGDDPGAYVMGWKWVGASDAGVPVEEKEEE